MPAMHALNYASEIVGREVRDCRLADEVDAYVVQEADRLMKLLDLGTAQDNWPRALHPWQGLLGAMIVARAVRENRQ